MMGAHDSSHDELLQAVLDGSQAASAELQACEVCAARLRARQATHDALRAAAEEERAVLAEARAMRDAVGEDLLGGLVRQGLRRRRPALRPRWLWLAAAAGLAIVALLWWSRAESLPTTPPDRMLGTTEYQPSGEVDGDLSAQGFRWPGPERAKYWLYVYDPDDSLEPWGTIVCEQNCWTPTAEFVARMRAVRADWYWVVGKAQESSTGGPPTIERSDTIEFSFPR